VAKHPVARLAGNRGAVAGAGRPGLGRLRRGPDHGAGGVGGVGDGPDPVVLAVGDPEAAVSGVERDVVQEVELGLQCGAVLALDRALTTALGAVDAVTGDRVDRGAAGGVEVDPANPGARLLGDEQVTHVVAGDAAGPVEVSIGRQATVTAVVADHRRGLRPVGVGLGGRHVAGDRGDDAAGIDLADEVVAAVGDVHGAVVGHPDTLGVVELGVDSEEAVTTEGLGLAVPGHGLDHRGRVAHVDLADGALAEVGDVEPVHAILVDQEQLLRRVDVGLESGAVDEVAEALVAAVLFTLAGDRADRVARLAEVDLADHAVAAVGDVDALAVGAHRDAVGLLHRDAGVRSRDAVGAERAASAAGRGFGSAPRNRVDVAGTVDDPHPEVQGVGEVDVTVRGEVEAPGVEELGRSGRARVAGEPALLVVDRGTGHRLDGAGRAGRADGEGGGQG